MSFDNIIDRNIFSRIFLAPHKMQIDTLQVVQLETWFSVNCRSADFILIPWPSVSGKGKFL